MEEMYEKKAEELNKAEIADSRKRIKSINAIIDKTVSLIREINEKLCHRDLDPSDRRLTEACNASSRLEDVLESLGQLAGYEIATIAIDRANIKEDE